jgi:hypothetical protein
MVSFMLAVAEIPFKFTLVIDLGDLLTLLPSTENFQSRCQKRLLGVRQSVRRLCASGCQDLQAMQERLLHLSQRRM